MKFRGLAFRLSVLFLTGILVIFTVAFFYTYNYTRKILLKEAERNAALLTSITMSRMENVLKPLEQIPNSLVAALDAQSPDPYQILLITQNVILDNPVVFASCIAFEPRSYNPDAPYYAHYIYETKTGIGSKLLGGPYDYFSRDWYRLPKEKGIPMWIGPYYDEGGGDTLMCTYSVPFYRNINGVRIFAGVLTMDISLSALSDIITSVRVPQAGYAFLLSRDGRFITSPVSSFLNKSIKSLPGLNNDRSIANLGRMLKGESGFMKMNELRTAEPSWIYFAPMPSTGWRFAVIYPERELFADMYDFFTRLLAIFVASVIALLVTIILISRNLAKPLSKLAGATRRIGEGDFHVPLPVIRSRTEIGDLALSFARMQDALKDYIQNLQEATIAQERMEGELKVAHTIQMGLLPTAFPKRPEIDLYAALIPARTIGGDLYDFFFLDDDRLFLAIGDVSGKGVPASLFMTITRTLFRSLTEAGTPLDETMAQVNKELCRDNPNAIFVTFITGIFRLGSGVLELCNAGHNPPLLRTAAGNVRPLAIKTNIPLGIMEDHPFKRDLFTINPGDQVLLYTDGITEAENAACDLFTMERLEKALAFTGLLTSAAIAEKVLGSVRSFAGEADQSDDITLVVLTCNERGLSREVVLRNDVTDLAVLKESLDAMGSDWHIPLSIVSTLNLVLEEIFTNIVFYGYEDQHEHLVSMCFRREGDILVIRVEDDGKPFNLLESTYKGFAVTLEEREIGGEGIHLVKELMENIEYNREGDKNRVVMRKRING
jgi:phosphoserine phosphatase RsbU/P